MFIVYLLECVDSAKLELEEECVKKNILEDKSLLGAFICVDITQSKGCTI